MASVCHLKMSGLPSKISAVRIIFFVSDSYQQPRGRAAVGAE